jgi:hypothetical protein
MIGIASTAFVYEQFVRVEAEQAKMIMSAQLQYKDKCVHSFDSGWQFDKCLHQSNLEDRQFEKEMAACDAILENPNASLDLFEKACGPSQRDVSP